MNLETVREGRDRYLAENSLTTESYKTRRFPIYVGRRPIYVPNPGLLPWHDLHHVATGYRTGLIGEAEISAYELRAGCGSLMIFILCVGAILMAMFVAPKRVWRAWRLAKGSRSLYHTKVDYEELLEMSVEDLRSYLGLPREGCA
jgi:ubiquinone biosynthesis protein COQ4